MSEAFHDRPSVGLALVAVSADLARAEKRVAELEEILDDIFVHGSVGPTQDWMMVPRVEWDQAMQRARLKPR